MVTAMPGELLEWYALPHAAVHSVEGHGHGPVFPTCPHGISLTR